MKEDFEKKLKELIDHTPTEVDHLSLWNAIEDKMVRRHRKLGLIWFLGIAAAALCVGVLWISATDATSYAVDHTEGQLIEDPLTANNNQTQTTEIDQSQNLAIVNQTEHTLSSTTDHKSLSSHMRESDVFEMSQAQKESRPDLPASPSISDQDHSIDPASPPAEVESSADIPLAAVRIKSSVESMIPDAHYDAVDDDVKMSQAQKDLRVDLPTSPASSDQDHTIDPASQPAEDKPTADIPPVNTPIKSNVESMIPDADDDHHDDVKMSQAQKTLHSEHSSVPVSDDMQQGTNADAKKVEVRLMNSDAPAQGSSNYQVQLVNDFPLRIFSLNQVTSVRLENDLSILMTEGLFIDTNLQSELEYNSISPQILTNISFTGLANFGSKIYSDNKNLSYQESRNATERFLDMYSFGTTADIISWNDFALRSGILYHYVTDVLEWQGEVYREEEIEHIESTLLTLQQEFIVQYGVSPTTVRVERYIKQYNEQHIVEIPVGLGYGMQFSRVSVGLFTDLNLSYRLGSTMTYLNELNAVESGVISSGLLPLSFSYGTTIGYWWNDHYMIGLSLQHRRIKFRQVDMNAQYRLWGMGIEVKRSF